MSKKNKVRKIANKTKTSKKRFKELFKGIPIPTYSWQKIDDDLILFDYNDAAEKITKGMIKNYVGTKASEMYKNRPEILEELFRCANDRVSIFREMKYDYMSTGEERFLSVMYGFIPPDLVIVHTEDITVKKEILERLKKSEKELKALTLELKQRIDISEEKYKAIFENTGTATIIVEEDTTISLINEQFEELFGYSREEVEWKKSWTEFIVEEDLGRMEKLHYFRRKDPKSALRKYEFRATDKKGDIRDIFIVLDLIPGTKQSVASLLDITERKKTEEKLTDSEAKYRYLFNNAQVGLYWSRISDGKFLECNDTFAKLFGYDTREEFLENYNAIEHYIDPNARSELIEEIRDNKEVKNYEINVTRRDGTPIWLNISTRISEKENRFEGAAIDITKRKKMEQKLKESEENYRYLFENSPISLWEEDASELKKYIETLKNSGIKDFRVYFDKNPEEVKKCVSMVKIINVNQKTLELYKANKKEDFFVGLDKVFTEESLDTFKEQIINFAGGKTRFESESINSKFNGVKLYILLVCEIVAGFKEDWSKVLISIIDISERKKAEEKLQLERDNFLNILNSMEDGVYIVDQNYDIEYVNPILTKEFGQFEGTKCFKYFEGQNEPCPRCKNKEVLQGKTVRGEWFSFKTQKTYDVIDTPIKNLDGSISKLGIFRDISESKKAEQVLKESEEKYREAYNRAEFYKDLFAHDINNILQSILSGIQISQLIVDNPEKRDNLKENAAIIKEQVIRGAKLVSNVQKLSKLEETGKILEKIEILNVLKNTISFVEKSCNDKKLAIRVDSLGEKLIIKANALLEDVFENLLINAIRHNTNLITEITVRISRERNVGKDFLKMEFMDNGIGVGDSMKEKIFQRGNNKDKGVYGMGLGLSLVRGIIESYNGKVWVEDRVKGDRSKGSNFVLVIPEVD